MTEQVFEPAWLAAGIFRPLLHRADLGGPAWRFKDWDGIWFAACRCPVTPLWGDTPAGRERCPDCVDLESAVPSPPIPRGRSDA